MPTEALDIIELGQRHIEGALALSEEAHWNQVEADWQMMMAAGNAIGMEDPDGRLVASALSLPYGGRFGWISMVLVTAEWQKKGLATRLLNACIKILEGVGLTPVLDATPAGENVYRPLGFLPHFGFQRWEHMAVENIDLVGSDETGLATIEAEAVYHLDVDIFGGVRRQVLDSLIDRSASFACLDESNRGFLLGRSGRVASQIGPISTGSKDGALNLLEFSLSRLKGRIFIDACDHQTEFIGRLKQYGFKSQRPFLRMAKDQAGNFGDRSRMFVMAGPELG